MVEVDQCICRQISFWQTSKQKLSKIPSITSKHQPWTKVNIVFLYLSSLAFNVGLSWIRTEYSKSQNITFLAKKMYFLIVL